MHQLLLTASTGGVELDFPSWLRITHFINFIMMGFLIRSGWEVLASHPPSVLEQPMHPGFRVAQVHQGQGFDCPR